MSVYLSLFRIRFNNSLQYRTAAIAGLATQFVWGFMYILAFNAFFAENPYAFPMTLQQTVSYIWIQQAFMALFFIWFWENNIIESVESGGIAYELVRPVNLYNNWAMTIAANRLSRCLLRAAPILIIAFILPAPFRLVLGIDFFTIILFLFSALLSLCVVIAFSMLIYISSFFTINGIGVRIVVGVGADFLAGGYIPVPFFPETIRRIVELLPFGSMQNMPLLIFNGYLYGADLARGLGLQIFWVVFLFVLGRYFMYRALERVVTQGG